MKKTIIICTLATIVAFGAGYLTCQKVNDVEFLKEANDFKKELLDAQDKALDKAWVLIDKHNLLDKDGSDDMCDFLEYNHTIKEMLDTQL